MKRLMLIFGVIMLVVFVLLWATPFIFQSQISQKVKSEINSQITGKVDYTGFQFSLFSSFPNPTISLQNLVIFASEDFKNDTLASVANFSFTVNLWSILKGSKYEILAISASHPLLRLKVNRMGNANWDILKKTLPFSKDASIEQRSAPLNFSMQVSRWQITQAFISSADDSLKTEWELNDLNADGMEFNKPAGYDIKSNIQVGELKFQAGEIPYIHKIQIKTKLNMVFNDTSNTYFLQDNETYINDLKLLLKGKIKSIPDGYHLDVTLDSKDSTFKEVLSLLPGLYDSSLESSGSFSISGAIKGDYRNNLSPQILVGLRIENGMFKKAGSSNPIQHISLYAQLSKPTGTRESLTLDAPKLHFETGKDSINGGFKLSHIASNAQLQAHINGTIDLESFDGLLPGEPVKEMSGLMQINLAFKGNQKDFEQKHYNQLTPTGNVLVTGFNYEKTNLPFKLHVTQATFTFEPGTINLDKLEGMAGRNPFSATGKINHLIAYVFNQEALTGDFNVSSNHLSVRDLINSTPVAPKAATHQNNNSTQHASLPAAARRSKDKGYRFTIRPSIRQVDYDKLVMEKLSGQIELSDTDIKLVNVAANLWGGAVTVNSVYHSLNGPSNVAFRFDLHNLDIQKVYKGIDALSTIAPTMKYITGNISGMVQGRSSLKEDKNLNYNTLIADGNITSQDLKLDELPVLMDIARLAKVKSLEHLKAKNVQSGFHFKNGNTIIDPTDIKFTSGYKMNFRGKNSSSGMVDADLLLEVPVKEFGTVASLAQNLLSGFMKVPETMQFKFNISGSNLHPDVKVMGVSTGE